MNNFLANLRRVLVLLMAVQAGIVSTARAAAAESRVTFSNSCAPLPAQAVATVRPALSTNLTETMEFGVALKMRSFAELQARLARGESIAPAEMDSRYLPLQKDYYALRNWLVSEGFTITQDDLSRLCIYAQGTVAQVQMSLKVSVVGVTVRGRDYHAADSQPSLPSSVAAPVLGVNGLQPYHHRNKHGILSVQNPNAPPFLVGEILNAYNATGLGVSGSGEKIAILIDTFPADSDLTAFWTANNIPQTLSNIEKVQVNATALAAASGEESLDVEWSSGIAPAAKVRIYASSDLTFTNLDKSFSRIISDIKSGSQPQMHQLSISLGSGETYDSSSQFNTDTQLLATIAAHGVSIFVSSGDAGATPDSAGGTSGPLQVEYYASDPNVTAVGGTTLANEATVPGGRTSVSESAWNDSGGGASVIFGRPSWQTGAGITSGTSRLVPDVCLAADPNTGATVYLGGTVHQYGGTSWSAPVWAGFCALMNEARAKQSKPALGFLNPFLYPLIGTNNFYDITSGNNATGNSGGKYVTTANYDQVTGIGAPNVANLLNTLVALPVAAPIVTGFSPSSGVVNSSVLITGSNLGLATSVTINGMPAGLTANTLSQITATVPVGATSGAIAVTTSAGTAMASGTFTVVAPRANSITISQIYGGGGSSGAPARNDFIELFNYGTTAVNISNWSVQYAAYNGSSWANSRTNLSGTIQPGHYYLVQEHSSGSNGAVLPTADATGTIDLNSTHGKVALVNSVNPLSGSNPTADASVVDFVGYSANAYEGTAAAPTLSVTTADQRNGGGYNDTNNNAADFSAVTPNPHNSSYVIPTPDLTIAKSHTGNFTQGDTGDTYTITVSNIGTGPTNGTPISVVDALPAGLTATGIGGDGWTANLASLTCTRSDALVSGTSYPPIIVTVNVSGTAAASVTNTATVSGGGENNLTNDTASDLTTIASTSTPIQSWRQQWFNTTLDSGTAADTAIAAGDALPNLLKYAVGLNPLVPAVNPAVIDTTTGYLRITVPRDPNATDVTLSAEVTADLAAPSSWTSDGVTIDQNTPTIFQAHDNVPLTSSTIRFIRLRVTRP